MVSSIPFPTPVGAVRIGKVDGNFVVNPTEEQQLTADLDLIVAGTDEAILMVEAGANEIPEAEMLDALDIAHGEIKKLCAAQRELAERVSKPKLEITAPVVDEGLMAEIQRVPRARAGRGHVRRGQARPPGRHEGGRGGGARQVLGRPRPPTRTRSTASGPSWPSTGSRRRSSASASRSTSAAPTGARPRRSGRSRSRWACCRARTARRSSPAARRRPCPSSRSARRARRCAWTTSGSRPPSATSTTTTSRPSRSGRRASCAAPSGATSATARSPSGRSCR